jgi:uncharacterized protein (TIGR02588 family)
MTHGDDGERQQRTEMAAGRKESSHRGRRSVAEWTTLAIGVVLILVVVGLVTFLYASGDDRQPVVEAVALDREIRHEEGAYYLLIAVTNQGDRTAEDVVIQAELSTGAGAPEVTEFTIDFLAGGETTVGTTVFTTDPSAGELTVGVTSFRSP